MVNQRFPRRNWRLRGPLRRREIQRKNTITPISVIANRSDVPDDDDLFFGIGTFELGSQTLAFDDTPTIQEGAVGTFMVGTMPFGASNALNIDIETASVTVSTVDIVAGYDFSIGGATASVSPGSLEYVSPTVFIGPFTAPNVVASASDTVIDLSFTLPVSGVSVSAGSATISPGPVFIVLEEATVSVSGTIRRAVRLLDATEENVYTDVYDVSVSNGILTAFASIQLEGGYVDPNIVVFTIDSISTGAGRVSSGNRLAYIGDLPSGKVSKIADGIFRYTENISQLVNGSYDVRCEAVFFEPETV